MSWSLWAFDYFDREASPSCDARGESRVEGIELLWSKTLAEGLDDRGQLTFTWFELRHDQGRAELPRDLVRYPSLAKLRAWRHEPGLLRRLAERHAAVPSEPTVKELLARADAAKDAVALLAAL